MAVIARQVGIDRKTVRKYIARGLEVPTYGPRQPRDRLLDPWTDYLKARLEAYPSLSAQRLLREISERGYTGGYDSKAIREAAAARNVLANLPNRSNRKQRFTFSTWPMNSESSSSAFF